MTYETKLLTKEEARRFRAFFDKEIGTEYEENMDGSDPVWNSATKVWYMALDLSQKEVELCRQFEKEV